MHLNTLSYDTKTVCIHAIHSKFHCNSIIYLIFQLVPKLVTYVLYNTFTSQIKGCCCGLNVMSHTIALQVCYNFHWNGLQIPISMHIIIFQRVRLPHQLCFALYCSFQLCIALLICMHEPESTQCLRSSVDISGKFLLPMLHMLTQSHMSKVFGQFSQLN